MFFFWWGERKGENKKEVSVHQEGRFKTEMGILRRVMMGEEWSG